MFRMFIPISKFQDDKNSSLIKQSSQFEIKAIKINFLIFDIRDYPCVCDN